MAQFADLVGVTLAGIEGAEAGSEVIVFTATDGRKWHMFHAQDCCETVEVAEVIGDIADLIGAEIALADESTSEDETPEDVTVPENRYVGESCTWTFYNLATIKGYVTLRWLGTSNGYYSESVYFHEVRP